MLEARGAGSYGCSGGKVATNREREMPAGSMSIPCARFVEHPLSRRNGLAEIDQPYKAIAATQFPAPYDVKKFLRGMSSLAGCCIIKFSTSWSTLGHHAGCTALFPSVRLLLMQHSGRYVLLRRLRCCLRRHSCRMGQLLWCHVSSCYRNWHALVYARLLQCGMGFQHPGRPKGMSYCLQPPIAIGMNILKSLQYGS